MESIISSAIGIRFFSNIFVMGYKHVFELDFFQKIILRIIYYKEMNGQGGYIADQFITSEQADHISQHGGYIASQFVTVFDVKNLMKTGCLINKQFVTPAQAKEMGFSVYGQKSSNK
jgi:hypothetical protein